jgi:hypothetical protein
MLQRWQMEWWYVWHFIMGRNPLRRIGTLAVRIVRHRLTRGRSFFADIGDWLGGWPMQFTRDADVIKFLRERGFLLTNIKAGEACTEFLFNKHA